MKKNTPSDHDLIEYILGSFELIQDYVKGYSEDSFFKSMIVQDAVCNRINEVGYAASLISQELTKKYPDFPWRNYTCFTFFNTPDVVWSLTGGRMKSKNKFESIESYFNELNNLYLSEFYPEKVRKSRKKDEVPLTRIYKYPIISRKSIWTVKKK